MSAADDAACQNTDRELWRERFGDFYASSIHVTQEGSVGINVCGHVIVMPLRKWHAAACVEAARQSAEPVKCGCHINQQPDGCVFDNGDIEDCRFAMALQRRGKGRDDCEHWKPITLHKPPEARQSAEPFGHVTVRRKSQRFENHVDQYEFYPAGQSPYIDNVDEVHAVYTHPPASSERIAALEAEVERLRARLAPYVTDDAQKEQP